MIRDLKFHLTRAQTRMKQQVDLHRSERHFLVGDWVWMKLQPYRQSSVHSRRNQKLFPKYFSPFKVVEKIGQVAYKLALPPESQIHNVVHVSQQKKFSGTLPKAAHIPSWLQGSTDVETMQPRAITDRRIIKRQNAVVLQYLIQWKDLLIIINLAGCSDF